MSASRDLLPLVLVITIPLLYLMGAEMSKEVSDVLRGKIVCISTSDSEEFFKPASKSYLLNNTRIEIVQQLLSRGCTIAYGGDLRRGGFTETLIDLVETAPTNNGSTNSPPLVNYLGWPSDIDLTEDQERRLSNKVKFIRTGLPSDIAGPYRPQFYIHPRTPKRYYIRARSLTHMRETISRDADACIVLSGRMVGIRGKYPGVVEETFLVMQEKKPTYVVSAFGGAAMDIAEALTGKIGNRISNEYQFMGKAVPENVQYFNSRHSATIDYRNLSSYFVQQGISGLNNQLTVEENRDLFKSTDPVEVASLIVRGLEKKFSV